jgi:hypothetical protein
MGGERIQQLPRAVLARGGVSRSSRNTPCSVIVSFVPSPTASNTTVATDTEMRASSRYISYVWMNRSPSTMSWKRATNL